MEPSVSRASRWARVCVRWHLCVLLGFWSIGASAQQPISLYQGFVGHFNYQATGGSLRSAPNGTNSCSLNPSSTGTIAGIPGGATISAAYLYWAGSGTTPDGTVTLNGSTVTADPTRSYTDTFAFNGTDYDFFSGFADVTTLIGGNGNVTFSGLTVNNGAPFCNVQAVVSGWGLIVVYEDAAEDLRAVNVFDGFQLFRANSVTLTVDAFRIPPSPINGKVTHITWEGDPQNSGTSGGVSESLTFNGSPLDDGLVPPGSAPTIQQFDGTINTLGVTTTYGVDVDTYDVSAFLNAGDTSASTTYSSGADLVLLSAEVISFTTEPVADLQILKSHTGDFTVGTNGDYLIQVSNLGPEPEANPIVVSDTLPAGLSFVSGTGIGWSCGAVAADVSCTHPGPIAVGASAPDLTLTVQVSAAAAPAVNNTATVSSASLDNVAANNTSTDATTVRASNLTTSTKSVVDLNGGDADPGDVLRYTITIAESAGIDAIGVTVTDDVPSLVTSFSIVSLPPGSTDASTGSGTGANGTGYLDIGSVFVAGGASVDIVFDVTVATGANPGDVIANQATIVNPNGIGASPLAPDVIVSASQVPNGGTKTLYLFDTGEDDPNGFDEGPQPYLSRTPPPGQSNVTVDADDPPRVWTMTPSTRAPLTIDAGTIPVTLYLTHSNNNPPEIRTLTVELAMTGAATGPLGTPVTQTFSAPPRNSPAAFTFNIPLAAQATLPAGTQITLTLTNTTPGGGRQRIRVFPTSGGSNSRIELPALTIINVDTAATFDAPYPGGVPQTQFAQSETVAVRADVSDPFGVFDIASVAVDITDPLGAPIVVAQAMTQSAVTSGASAVYEYLFTVPAAAPAGTWTYQVTAVEGTEGTVTHSRGGSFVVGQVALLISKSVATLSDPVNGTTDPKAIPGASMLYTLTISNNGDATVDGDSLVVVDNLPAATALYVDTSGGDPIEFVDGSPPSGLTYDFSADVSFSNQAGGGPPFSYVPVPDAQGFDAAVTGISINPAGSIAGNTGSGAPEFEIRYRLRID